MSDADFTFSESEKKRLAEKWYKSLPRPGGLGPMIFEPGNMDPAALLAYLKNNPELMKELDKDMLKEMQQYGKASGDSDFREMGFRASKVLASTPRLSPE